MTKAMKTTDHYKRTFHIDQSCGDCIIRVEGWTPHLGSVGFVDVQIISNHTTAWNLSLKNRFKHAWKVLRGTYDWSGFELFTAAEAQAVIEALEDAAKEAWPSDLT